MNAKYAIKLATYLLQFAIGVSLLLVLFAGSLLSIRNNDFFDKFLQVDNIIPIFVFMILGLLCKFSMLNSYSGSWLKGVINLLDRIFPIYIIIYLIILLIEFFTYPNFVFTTINIIPLNAGYFLYLFIAAHIIHKYSAKHLKSVIVFAILAIVLILSLRSTLQLAISKTVPFTSTYDEKMEFLWGDYYKFIGLARKITPEKSAIIIPPQADPWLKEGNNLLMRSFLYPRIIVRSPMKGQKNYYVLSSGFMGVGAGGKQHFPIEDINCKSIHIFDFSNKSIRSMPCPYNQNDTAYDHKFGLIEL